MAINIRRGKWWYICMMECYLALIKERNSAISNNVDESVGYYAVLNKLVAEEQILYYSTSIGCCK